MRVCMYCGRDIQEPPKSKEICVLCKSVYSYLQCNPTARKKIIEEIERRNNAEVANNG